MDALLPIFFRWMHVMTAAIVIGALVFIRLILPVGLKVLEPEQATAVFLRCRRVFKMLVHTGILLLLISGVYNALRNWAAYQLSVPLSHAFFGSHVLLALIVFVVALYVLSGKELRPRTRQLMLTNIVLLTLVVATASTVKWVREHPTVAPPAATK